MRRDGSEREETPRLYLELKGAGHAGTARYQHHRSAKLRPVFFGKQCVGNTLGRYMRLKQKLLTRNVKQSDGICTCMRLEQKLLTRNVAVGMHSFMHSIGVGPGGGGHHPPPTFWPNMTTKVFIFYTKDKTKGGNVFPMQRGDKNA